MSLTNQIAWYYFRAPHVFITSYTCVSVCVCVYAQTVMGETPLAAATSNQIEMIYPGNIWY